MTIDLLDIAFVLVVHIIMYLVFFWTKHVSLELKNKYWFKIFSYYYTWVVGMGIITFIDSFLFYIGSHWIILAYFLFIIFIWKFVYHLEVAFIFKLKPTWLRLMLFVPVVGLFLVIALMNVEILQSFYVPSSYEEKLALFYVSIINGAFASIVLSALKLMHDGLVDLKLITKKD